MRWMLFLGLLACSGRPDVVHELGDCPYSPCEEEEAEPEVCDIHLQDCDAGDKCNWVPTREEWNVVQEEYLCVPEDEDPRRPGEACDTRTDGSDECEKGSSCSWGVCRAVCNTRRGDTCDPYGLAEHACYPIDGTVGFCLEECRPLDPGSCPVGYTCGSAGSDFVCVPSSASRYNAGATCRSHNQCAPGLVCLGDTCKEVCDVDAPDCIGDKECVPWTEDRPDLGRLGICRL